MTRAFTRRKPHADQLDHADLGARDHRLDIQADELRDQREEHQHRDQRDHDDRHVDHVRSRIVATFNLCQHHHEVSPSQCIAGRQIRPTTSSMHFTLRTTGIVSPSDTIFTFEPAGMMPSSDIASSRLPSNSHSPMGRISVMAVPTWPSEKTGLGGADSAWFRMSRFPTGVCGQRRMASENSSGLAIARRDQHRHAEPLVDPEAGGDGTQDAEHAKDAQDPEGGQERLGDQQDRPGGHQQHSQDECLSHAFLTVMWSAATSRATIFSPAGI